MATGTSRAQQKLRRQVIAEEPTCWLRYEGCTGISTTADHIIPISIRPDLADIRSNMRGACKHCNYRRSNGPPPTRDIPQALGFFV